MYCVPVTFCPGLVTFTLVKLLMYLDILFYRLICPQVVHLFSNGN